MRAFVLLTVVATALALPASMLYQKDEVQRLSASVSCYGNQQASWERMVTDQCVQGELNEKNFYAALDQLYTGNIKVLAIEEHSSNAPDGDFQSKFPKIHFPVAQPGVNGAVTFQYPNVDQKRIMEFYRKIGQKDVLMFVWGCNGDWRRAPQQNALQNAKIKLLKTVVQNGQNWDYKGQEFAKEPLAFNWDSMLKIHDELLSLKEDRFYTGTIKELAAYMILRQRWHKTPNEELIPVGFMQVHNIPGSLTYPTLPVKNNYLTTIRKAKQIFEILPFLRDLAIDNDKPEYSNAFQVTYAHGLQRVFDIIRFCRSGIQRRVRSTLKLESAKVLECLGSTSHDYASYVECCVGGHLLLNKEVPSRRVTPAVNGILRSNNGR